MKSHAIIACELLLAAVCMASPPLEDLSPQESDSVERLYEKGERALETQEIKNAVLCWTMVLKRNPDDVEALLNRGNVYSSRDAQGEMDHDKSAALAIADFTEAIRLNPKDLRAYRSRAGVHFDDESAALADFAEAVAANPGNPAAFMMRAEYHEQRHQREEALNDYTAAIGADLKFAPAYRARAYLYEQSFERDKAIADYTAEIASEKVKFHLGKAYYRRGLLYLKAGANDEALVDFKQAIRTNKADAGRENYDFYVARGDAYRAKGEYTRAIDDYVTAIRSKLMGEELRDSAHMGIGEAYWAMGDKEKALKNFEVAVQGLPNYKDFIRIGLAEYGAGHYDKAVAYFTESLVKCGEEPRVYALRGAAYEAQGDGKKAGEEYEQAVKLAWQDCDNRQWKNPGAIDELATVEARMGRFEEAVKHGQMALDIARRDKMVDPEFTKAVEARLVLYKEKKAFREEKELPGAWRK